MATPVIPTPCLLTTEISKVPCFDALDNHRKQALIVWLKAQILKLLGGNDYTNVNTLMQSIPFRNTLSPSRLESFHANIWQNAYIAAGGKALTLTQIGQDTQCLVCVDDKALRTARTALLCELINLGIK